MGLAHAVTRDTAATVRERGTVATEEIIDGPHNCFRALLTMELVVSDNLGMSGFHIWLITNYIDVISMVPTAEG